MLPWFAMHYAEFNTQWQNYAWLCGLYPVTQLLKRTIDKVGAAVVVFGSNATWEAIPAELTEKKRVKDKLLVTRHKYKCFLIFWFRFDRRCAE